MTIAHLLESFDDLQTTPGLQLSLSEDSLEDQKLASFETGYKAGWDDAVKAQADDNRRISSDLAQNLSELSFTYHEAYSQMMKALKPLLNQVVGSILPELARKSLGAQIVEQLLEMAAGMAGQGIEVVVSPKNSEALQSMIENDLNLPVKVVEETSLGEGQAYLRLGQSERQIDNQDVLSGIALAVEAFFHEMQRNAQKKEA